MRNILILAVLGLSLTMTAQTKTKDTASKDEAKLVINESTKTIDLDATEAAQSYKPSGYTATYKGKVYQVYESSKGKLFIFMVSKKSGKEYKKYLN